MGGGGPRRGGRGQPDPAPHAPASQTSCLQYLDARNTPLLDHSAPFVARALRIRSSLAVLHLESASLSGRPLMLLGEPRGGALLGSDCWPGPPGLAGHNPLPLSPSHGPEDEHDSAGAVPCRQQAQRPAGLRPARQPAQVQLLPTDPGSPQQPRAGLRWVCGLHPTPLQSPSTHRVASQSLLVLLTQGWPGQSQPSPPGDGSDGTGLWEPQGLAPTQDEGGAQKEGTAQLFLQGEVQY